MKSSIHSLSNGLSAPIRPFRHMGLNLGGSQVFVSQKFLHGTHSNASLDEMLLVPYTALWFAASNTWAVSSSKSRQAAMPGPWLSTALNDTIAANGTCYKFAVNPSHAKGIPIFWNRCFITTIGLGLWIPLSGSCRIIPSLLIHLGHLGGFNLSFIPYSPLLAPCALVVTIILNKVKN